MDMQEATKIMDRINAIDFKAFTIEELKRISPDIFLRVRESKPMFKAIEASEVKSLTISEHGFFKVSKGVETMFLDIDIYLNDSESDETAYRLYIHTKERHDILKAIIKRIVNQL